MTDTNFKKIWGTRIRFSPLLGVMLILFFGIPRFILVLSAGRSGNYSMTSLIFLAMCLLPFVLLNRQGRKRIGLKAPAGSYWWIYALLIGMLACLAVYVTGTALYGHTVDNWFVYISKSFEANIPVELAANRARVFLIMAAAAVTLSPLGEELLYRGLIHECFVPSFGEGQASMIDSAAFAITHLAHFGILNDAGAWGFHFIPALLWVLLMYFAGRLFFFCKYKGGSLMMAIICHAGFNLAMTYFICFHIL